MHAHTLIIYTERATHNYTYVIMFWIFYFAGGGSENIKLRLVTKQILIHKLPPTLILHFKRFNIGDYHVTKNTTLMSFPQLLDMAPYCSTECLKVLHVRIHI